MLGLTELGTVHTTISLAALLAGIASFLRSGEIKGRDKLGRIYVLTTILTCLTAFGIFQHGGFGKAHALGVLTLVVLAVAYTAERVDFFGRFAPYIATVGYTATYLFHLVPAVTETFTRLPAGNPVFLNADAPGLQNLTLSLLVVFLVVAGAQVAYIWGSRKTPWMALRE